MADEEKEATVIHNVLPYGEGGGHESSPPRGNLTPEWEAQSDEVGVPSGSVVQEAGLGKIGDKPSGEDADSTDPGTAENPVIVETVPQEPPPPEDEEGGDEGEQDAENPAFGLATPPDDQEKG